MATAVHFPIERAGIIGLPAPGSEIKMVPEAGKFELRVRGPNVTPGYWRRDDLTAMAFDEDGYYRIGDAGKFADDDDPAQGLIFDGRLTEDFKLMSGTWVHVGALRIKAITAGAPVIQDAVVTADGRENVGLLIFADANGCRGLCPDAGPETAVAALIARPEVHRVLCEGLNAYNAINPGNSSRIDRVLLMAEPPSIDAGEITDKGYINQRAVLEKRRHLVDELYAGDLPHIILLD